MFAPAELKNGAGDSSRGGYAGKTCQGDEALLESAPVEFVPAVAALTAELVKRSLHLNNFPGNSVISRRYHLVNSAFRRVDQGGKNRLRYSFTSKPKERPKQAPPRMEFPAAYYRLLARGCHRVPFAQWNWPDAGLLVPVHPPRRAGYLPVHN